MKDPTLRSIYLLFLLMGAIVVGVSVAALRTINRDAASSDWVNHTHATIYELDGMVSELQSGDGMMRSYALTGDTRDLAECRSAFARLIEHLAVARALTHDNPAIQASLTQLETAAQDRIRLADSIRGLRDTGRAEEMKALLQREAGTPAAGEFQRQVTRLRNRQFELLTERDRESYRQAQTTRWIVGLGVASNLLLFAGAAWLIRVTLATRRKLAETLQEANAVLEQRVLERTGELTAANRHLTTENLQRKWTSLSQEHQLRYNHAIIGAISDLVFVLSKSLNVTRLNPAVMHATGRAEEEILGRPAGEFLRLPGATGGADPLARAVRDGRELTAAPALLLDRHGQGRAGVVTVVPLIDNNQVVGAVAVLRLNYPA